MKRHGDIMAKIKNSNGEVSMRMKAFKTPKSSGWLAKVSRVLIFTMLFSAFMHQGWFKPQPAEAAITYQTPGAIAYSAAAGTTVAPAYPASIAANDLLVMIIGMKPSTASSGSVTTPAGWIPIVSLIGAGGYGATLAADTGNTNLFAYYKVAAGTETGSLTVTIATNNISWAQIYRLSKALAIWDVAGATGSDITGDATVSIAFGSNPGVAANDFILGAMGTPTDIGVGTQFSAEAFTQTGATFGAATEISEPYSILGNQIGGFVVRAAVNAGPGSAAPTMTATAGGTLTNVRGPGVFVRIREAKSPSTITSCSGCHGYTSVFTDGPTRNNPTGAFIGDHTAHVVKVKTACTICHVAPADTTSVNFPHRTGTILMQSSIKAGTYSRGASFLQTNTPTTGTCATISCHGGNNPTPQWGVGTATCISCHSGTVTADNASIATGGAVTSRASVTAEFGLAWGHKKSGRGAVTDADCIVCHLEGEFSTQKTSSKHADGYIDLRDPDGVGEVAITNNSGAAFTFTKYAISYAASARTTTLSNGIPEVITVKFCMKCHDANGATNTTARTTYGAPTAAMPFGGIALGANWSATNGAIGTQGLIDVVTQFAATNSSRHPVGAPNLRAYPYSNRLLAPYNNIGTTRDTNTMANNTSTPRTKANSVVMVCDDCHTTGTSVTTRTITAHGNAASLRGNHFVASPTLCLTCHIASGANTYPDTGATQQHGTGSAFFAAAAGDEDRPAAAMTQCNFCHFSTNATYAAANRPRYAADVHGFNTMYGSATGWAAGSAINMRPVAFMRSVAASGGSWPNTHSPRPYVATGVTAGAANCGSGTNFAFSVGTTGLNCGSNSHTTYRPGGSF